MSFVVVEKFVNCFITNSRSGSSSYAVRLTFLGEFSGTENPGQAAVTPRMSPGVILIISEVWRSVVTRSFSYISTSHHIHHVSTVWITVPFSGPCRSLGPANGVTNLHRYFSATFLRSPSSPMNEWWIQNHSIFRHGPRLDKLNEVTLKSFLRAGSNTPFLPA